MLQRTQLMLDEETKNDLLYLSQVTNKSMSELVRSFVAEKVKNEKRKVSRKIGKKKMSAVDALIALAKEAKEIDRKYGYEGPTDASINHDYYLYGLPKNKK